MENYCLVQLQSTSHQSEIEHDKWKMVHPMRLEIDQSQEDIAITAAKLGL